MPVAKFIGDGYRRKDMPPGPSAADDQSIWLLPVQVVYPLCSPGCYPVKFDIRSLTQ
jgi:hypothetical protein